MKPGDTESSATVGVHEGDVLAGKYRVDKVLGVGGMGMVVAAHHLQLDEKVALKFLLPAALSNPQAVSRFEREARAAVKIKSEHVARIIDVGKLETGAPYMVLEYLEGGDLAAWLAQRGALPVEQAVEFVLQACEAIAEAHSLGIVHRDLKPANLFCIRRTDGLLSVKVLDFGISKLVGPNSSQMDLTKTQSMMGSPYYMSPEQMVSSKDVDARTDIWALGAVLFELVTRRLPFMAEALPELVLKIATHPTPSLRESLPNAPAGLDAVIARCLEKDPARRYPNVAELAHALLEFAPKRSRGSVERVSRVIEAAGLSTSALALPSSSMDAPPGAPNDVPAQTAPTHVSWGETSPSAPKRSPVTALVIGAGLALLGVVGVIAVVLVMSKKPETDAAGAALSAAPTLPAPAESVALPPPDLPAKPETPPTLPAPSASSASVTPAVEKAQASTRALQPTLKKVDPKKGSVVTPVIEKPKPTTTAKPSAAPTPANTSGLGGRT